MNLAASPLAVATLSFATAAAVTTSLAPMVRRFGLQLGLTDKPDPRKQHNSPMVRLGGIAMVFGFLLALSVIWGLGGFGLLAPERDQLIWSTWPDRSVSSVSGSRMTCSSYPPGHG